MCLQQKIPPDYVQRSNCLIQYFELKRYDSKAFIEHSNDMDGIYKIIEEYNPNKKRKISIVLDDMIANLLSNKKLNSLVTELFIRGRKLNISYVFITQSYFKVPKDIRLNTTHFFYYGSSKQKRTSTNCV